MIYLEQTTPLSLKSALQAVYNGIIGSQKYPRNKQQNWSQQQLHRNNITTTKATNKSTTILGRTFSLLHYCFLILHAMFDCAYLFKHD